MRSVGRLLTGAGGLILVVVFFVPLVDGEPLSEFSEDFRSWARIVIAAPHAFGLFVFLASLRPSRPGNIVRRIAIACAFLALCWFAGWWATTPGPEYGLPAATVAAAAVLAGVWIEHRSFRRT